MSTAWVKPPATTTAASSTSSLNLFPGPNKSMNNNNESSVIQEEDDEEQDDADATPIEEEDMNENHAIKTKARSKPFYSLDHHSFSTANGPWYNTANTAGQHFGAPIMTLATSHRLATVKQTSHHYLYDYLYSIEPDIIFFGQDDEGCFFLTEDNHSIVVNNGFTGLQRGRSSE